MNKKVYLNLAETYKDMDKNMLFVLIARAYNAHMKNSIIPTSSKFFLGLRYSEFLAEGTSNEDYYNADILRKQLLDIMGVTYKFIDDGCLKFLGLY